MSEPLLLLPAMMSDARLFAEIMPGLSQERAVMFCPLAQGERIEELASGVISAAPARFALFGADLGAMVAMEVMRRAPERVTRLALASTTPLPESPQHAAAREPLMAAARAGRLTDVMDELVPAQVFAPGPGRLQAQGAVRRMAQDQGAEVFVRQMRALQRRRDQQSTLRRITQPTLVLCGDHEGIYPIKRHRFMAELIPSGQCAVVPGAGHLPMIEAPQATLEALRAWLAA